MIDYKRTILNLNSILLETRQIPKHSSLYGLIMYENGLFSYILIPNTVIKGKIFFSNFYKNLNIGNYVPLIKSPHGMQVYNVELKLGFGGQIARAAGSFVKILNKFPTKYNKLLVQLKSGEQYLIHKNCGATIGVAGNVNHWLKIKKKASMTRKLGYKPTVRGIAMNPVDHPHGGRTNGGRPSVSPTGFLTKGKKTRHKQILKTIIFKRRYEKI